MTKSRKTKQPTKRAQSSNKQVSEQKLLTVERAEFSGPIPPPNILNQYPEDVRTYIVNSAYKEQIHRHNLEDKMIKTDSKATMVGSYTTSIVCIIAIVGGILLVALGEDGIGITTILAPIIIKGLHLLSGLENNPTKNNDKHNNPQNKKNS